MKYIYKEDDRELIDKLKSYKLNKIDEKLIINNFLNILLIIQKLN